MVRITSLATAVMAAVPLVAAHGATNDAEMVKREMEQRNAQHAKAVRSMGACQNNAESLALRSRAVDRRAAKARDMRAARGLTAPMAHHKRDLANLEKYVGMDHNRTGVYDYDLATPPEVIFGGNNTCALVPETTVGPYWVTGESVRQDITEGQAGVPLHLEMQFVDMNTCMPVPALAIDVWHCNSTGVYSGVPGDDLLGIQGGLNSTFMRGVQFSDVDGVAAFDTMFPGHYQDRVTHFHLIVNEDPELLPNGTYVGGNVLHIGQIYFDDALVKDVETNEPYSTNTIAYTSWEDDGWMLDEATSDYDPIAEYVQLGSDVQDGILGWITVAVDLSSNHTSNATAAAHYYEGGGVSVSRAMPSGTAIPTM